MKIPKKPKPTLSDYASAYQQVFKPHPHQQDFLDAAIALRAKDVDSEATVRAEFKAGLTAILFPPSERRFYFMWTSDEYARLLIHYTQTAWKNASGKYGDRQPIHYTAKPNVKN